MKKKKKKMINGLKWSKKETLFPSKKHLTMSEIGDLQPQSFGFTIQKKHSFQHNLMYLNLHFFNTTNPQH